MFTEQSLRRNLEAVKAFTGIPSENFWELMKEMGEQAEAYERERHQRAERKRAEGGGRQYEHPLVIRVAIVLTDLPLHVAQAVVALLYGCEQSDVSRKLRRTLPLISRVVPVPELWQLSETLEEDVVDELPLDALSDGRVLAGRGRVQRPDLRCCTHRRQNNMRRSGPVPMLPLLLVSGVRAGMPMTVPLPVIGAKGHDRASARRLQRPSPSPSAVVTVGHRQQNNAARRQQGE